MKDNKNHATSALSSDHSNNSDWFLQILVNTCNNTEISFPITLNVGGLLISGELIGGEKYFNGFINDLKMGGFPPGAADLFNKFGDIYNKPNEQEQDKQDDETTPLPQYIHLKNARIFHPGGSPIPANRRVWWRGRLEAIDGFILGTLSI